MESITYVIINHYHSVDVLSCCNSDTSLCGAVLALCHEVSK